MLRFVAGRDNNLLPGGSPVTRPRKELSPVHLEAAEPRRGQSAFLREMGLATEMMQFLWKICETGFSADSR
jgi:hypothetical protein